MDSLPNFTRTNIETVWQLAHGRCREPIEINIVDSTLIPKHGRGQLVDYPTLFWHMNTANFAVIRPGLNRFRCRFFMLHKTSIALTEKNTIPSNSALPPLLQTQRQIITETMISLESNACLVANRIFIETGVGNSFTVQGRST